MGARALCIAVLGLAGVLTTPVVADSDGRSIVMRAWPRTSAEPGYIELTIELHPRDGDRALVVEIDSGDLFRSSVIELEGAAAARRHRIRFDWLPPGHYIARVSLEGQGELPPPATESFRVIGAPNLDDAFRSLTYVSRRPRDRRSR